MGYIISRKILNALYANLLVYAESSPLSEEQHKVYIGLRFLAELA